MSPRAARVLALSAMLGAMAAHAQAGASVATPLGENNGIRVGPGRLHPYFELEPRYDSAALYVPVSPTDPTLVLKPEILMHFRPGFRLDVPGTDVTFGLNGFYDYVWYTGLLTSGSSAASRNEAGAEMHAEINREGAVEADVGDTFSRSDRPRDFFHRRAFGLGPGGRSLRHRLSSPGLG